jgi:hypothetical protein
MTIMWGNTVLIMTITYSYSTKVLTKSETIKMKITVLYVLKNRK